MTAGAAIETPLIITPSSGYGGYTAITFSGYTDGGEGLFFSYGDLDHDFPSGILPPDTASGDDRLSPSFGVHSGGTIVSVVWSGLAAGATLTFDGIALPSWDGATFTAPVHAEGPVDVVVTNPGGPAHHFTYTSLIPPMTLPFIPAGTYLAYYQSNGPIPGDTDGIGGAPRHGLAYFGSGSFTVLAFTNWWHNPDTGAYLYAAVAPGDPWEPTEAQILPTVDALTPTAGPREGGAAATITGTRLKRDATGAPADVVTFILFRQAGGAVDPATVDWLEFTVEDDTTITGVIPEARADAGVPLGVYDLYVYFTDLAEPLILAEAFAYIGLEPNADDIFGGAVVLVVAPDPLVGATLTIDTQSVAFDGSTFIAPMHQAGKVGILITPADGPPFTLPFTYYHPPILSPAFGRVGGGASIDVRRVAAPEEGADTAFVDGATILIDGAAVPAATRLSADLYSIVTPPHARGFVDVSITNLDARAITMDLPAAFFFGDSGPAPALTIAPPAQVAAPPLPSTVTLRAAVVGGALTAFAWAQTAGPERVTINAPTSAATTITFTTYTPGLYVFAATASDPSGAMPSLSGLATVTLPRRTPPRITV